MVDGALESFCHQLSNGTSTTSIGGQVKLWCQRNCFFVTTCILHALEQQLYNCDRADDLEVDTRIMCN